MTSESKPEQGASVSSALDYLFNRKPQDGSAAKEASELGRRMNDKGKAADALGLGRQEDPQVRARFEKYLSTAQISPADLREYDAKFRATEALLRQGKTFEAWKQLYLLAEFKGIDAGVSRALATRIESIWNTDKTSNQVDESNRQLRDSISTATRNADVMSGTVRERELDYQKDIARINRNSQPNNRRNESGTANNNQNNGGVPQAGPDVTGGAPGGVQPAPSVDGVLGKLQLTEEYLKSLEAKARIKLNELKVEKLLDTAKQDFASYVTTLHETGRHRHVILAADFYLKLFEEGDYPVGLNNQVNAAMEVDREVESAVEVFRFKAESGDVAEAADRLQEAFLISEFHPAVLGLERPLKLKVAAFTSRLNRMQNMIEARDFTSLESLLADMRTVAPDFDATKPMAIVNAVKLESQLRLGKAKLAAQQGDLKLAMEEFQAAAEAWPGNPDLKDKAMTFFDTQDVKSQSLVEFDRLVTENNYRGIFEKQLTFAPAMKDDTKRQEQLKEALEKVKVAEMAIEKAGLLRVNGDIHGAWETIEKAVAQLPNDLKLSNLRGELAGRGAEFVSAINRAKEAEAKSQWGYSLTWYAIAQRQYPASQIANEAMERLSRQIMNGKTL